GYEILGSYETGDADNAARLMASTDRLSLHEVDHADRDALLGLVEAVAPNREVRALINCQFYFAMEDLANFDFDLWDRSLAINLSAPAYLYHGLAERFSDRAAVVTITSTEGFVGS